MDLDGRWKRFWDAAAPNAVLMESERLVPTTFWEMDRLILLLRTVSAKDSQEF